jgi:glycosyltransferase involved in cell wall biosynthesis
MRRKILFISHSSNLYGAERSLATLVNSLSGSEEFDVYLALPSHGKLEGILTIDRSRLFVVPYVDWIYRNRFIAQTLAIPGLVFNTLVALLYFSKFKQIKPDIVYTNTLATPFGFILSLMLKCKHVWHVREFVHEDMNYQFSIGTRLSLKLVDRSDAVIFNSNSVMNKFKPYLTLNNTYVVYNGIRFNPDNYIKPERKYSDCVEKSGDTNLYIIGTVKKGKGQLDAIMALGILRENGVNVRLHIVGGGKQSYRERLEKIAADLNVSDRITWHGLVDNVVSYLRDAAVLLVCSKAEAFGRIAVEAMACGTPVIGTGSGGLPEIIIDGTTGSIYEPGNHMELAGKVTKLLADRNQYLNYSLNAFKYIKDMFDIDNYVDRISQLLLDT